jgi:3-hydroxypropanoate dehydrogenase
MPDSPTSPPPTSPTPAPRLDSAAVRQLFHDARTHNGWLPREVPDTLLRDLVEITRWAPTSVNMSPMRLVFVRSAEAKARLKPFLMDGNVAKTMAAPVTAIVAYDLAFYEHLPRLFPAYDARSWFVGNDELTRISAVRNGTLQGGYLILAARALGLDCGAMSGFDNAGVDGAFFDGTQVRSNFLLNLGYGDPTALYPRGPRFDFDDIARIV